MKDRVHTVAPRLIDAIRNADGTANSIDHPARWGSTITLRVTGAGPYDPPLDDGKIASGFLPHRLQQAVGIAFLISGPAPEAGSIAGVSRIDVRLPPSRPYPYSPIESMFTIGTVALGLPGIWVE